jgi:hypothetical protein
VSGVLKRKTSQAPAGLLDPSVSALSLASDERDKGADQAARWRTNHSCGDAKLKHGRPRCGRVNLQADHKPDGHSNGSGEEHSRDRAVPERGVSPYLDHRRFHRARIIDLTDSRLDDQSRLSAEAAASSPEGVPGLCCRFRWSQAKSRSEGLGRVGRRSGPVVRGCGNCPGGRAGCRVWPGGVSESRGRSLT